MKKIVVLLLSILALVFIPTTLAAGNNFVSVVNPVRGFDFWELKDQRPEDAVAGQISILKQSTVSATWLLRFDALDNKNIIDELQNRSSDEKGLFMEITPSLANQAKVNYRESAIWHSAGSAFLTGYERPEREKLIDASFEKFKNIFGYYPTSVGAWWIDAYSMDYMQKKYGITTALIVADQYSTDNYQIWGQYFGTPYYPSKNNALHPAQTTENKLDIVVVQWAARDPVNGYGNGVTESTFSVQANDYLDYHDLNTSYFSKLVDIYTKQNFNQVGHLVVGLENSYDWSKYSSEYKKQIEVVAAKRDSNQFVITQMKSFADWYRKNFPRLSPEQLIVADDPLGSFKKAVWFMDPYYRVGWFANSDGSVFKDIRQYVDGEEELCYKARCDSMNFATSATRVLDDVSFGTEWIVDSGRISNFKISRQGSEVVVNYQNEAGNQRNIGFLSRDINIDGKIFSIDQAILNATKKENVVTQTISTKEGSLKWSLGSVLLKVCKFIMFMFLAIIFPGLIITNRFFNQKTPFFLRMFISLVSGLVVLTFLFYLASLIKVKPLIYGYILLFLILFIRLRCYSLLIVFPKIRGKFSLGLITIILAGVVFQTIPTFRSGLSFGYGMGFWGPNTHDGVWHIALINQLVKSVPAENPIYAGVGTKNYHYFYDLLIAVTNYLSGISVPDLIFRFYPILFSLLLGIGSYYLVMRLFENKIEEMKLKLAAIISLYFIFFAGSFGWIVEFIRERHLGGESAFWVNQPASLNLNPPFAISLVIMITILHMLLSSQKIKSKINLIIAIIMFGTLVSFKSYTGILLLGSLYIVAFLSIFRSRNFSYFWISFFASIISVLLFLSNFTLNSSFLVFAPFWFIHSMVDSPDRVGWIRLSLARTSSLASGQWPKLVFSEIISLLMFIFGNLGLRFFSFGLIVKIKEIFKNDVLLFISVISIFSLGIPILFIQAGNPWNTIQFFYPLLYITALFNGVVISALIFKINRIAGFILVSLIFILTPINSVITVNSYLGNMPHAIVGNKEVEALQFLSTKPDGVVLTYPYDGKLKQTLKEPWPLFAYDSTAYVSALSKKNIFLEDEPQNQILLTDYTKRIVASKDFFLKPIAEGSKFLTENHINYIYLPKIYNLRLDESRGFIKNIFENEDVVIYLVKS